MVSNQYHSLESAFGHSQRKKGFNFQNLSSLLDQNILKLEVLLEEGFSF